MKEKPYSFKIFQTHVARTSLSFYSLQYPRNIESRFLMAASSSSSSLPSRKLPKINRDTRPKDSEYALMSAHAYKWKNGRILQSTLPEFEKLKEMGWEIMNSRINTKTGFAGVIYINQDRKQVVVAFRGTNSLKAWLEDIRGILFHGKGMGQRNDADIQIRKALKFVVGNDGYSHISFTGHSLGGFLAELSILFLIVILREEEQAKTITFNSVTFESPGCLAIWEKLNSNVKSCQIRPEAQDIIGYVSYPNLINTFDQPIGTLYHIKTKVEQGNGGSKLWDYWPFKWLNYKNLFSYTKQSHAMTNIVEWFERKENEPLFMTDWPQGLQYKIFEKLVSVSDQGIFELSCPPGEIDGVDSRASLESMAKHKYRLNFGAHFQPKVTGNVNLMLPLKHFSLGIQDFIKELKDPGFEAQILKLAEGNTKIQKYLEEVSLSLLDRTDLEIVEVKEGNVTEFRSLVSEWLENNYDTVLEQLSIPDKLLASKENQGPRNVQVSTLGEGSTITESGTLEGNTAAEVNLIVPKDTSPEGVQNIQTLANFAANITSNSGGSTVVSTLGKNTRVEGNVKNNTAAAFQIKFT